MLAHLRDDLEYDCDLIMRLKCCSAPYHLNIVQGWFAGVAAAFSAIITSDFTETVLNALLHHVDGPEAELDEDSETRMCQTYFEELQQSGCDMIKKESGSIIRRAIKTVSAAMGRSDREVVEIL